MRLDKKGLNSRRVQDQEGSKMLMILMTDLSAFRHFIALAYQFVRHLTGLRISAKIIVRRKTTLEVKRIIYMYG